MCAGRRSIITQYANFTENTLSITLKIKALGFFRLLLLLLLLTLLY